MPPVDGSVGGQEVVGQLRVGVVGEQRLVSAPHAVSILGPDARHDLLSDLFQDVAFGDRAGHHAASERRLPTEVSSDRIEDVVEAATSGLVSGVDEHVRRDTR